MRRALLPGLALLAACEGGPNDASRLTRLQVLAVVAEPPELAPGGTATATIWVADPTGGGVEVVAWTCTDLGAGCLEAAVPAVQRALVPPVTDGVAVVAVAVPPEFAPLVAQAAVPMSLWVLACAPGVCPLIGDARAGAADPSALSDPPGLLDALPIDGVSLVRRDLLVSAAAEPNVNPVFVETPEPPAGVAGSEVPLAFSVDDASDLLAVAYTTRGAMSSPVAEANAVDATWFTEQSPGSAQLWIVVEDGLGGSAVWRETGTVTAPARP